MTDILDFSLEVCEAKLIDLETYKKLRDFYLNSPTKQDCKDDHIQIEVEENKEQ